jgi:hypothetical protein
VRSVVHVDIIGQITVVIDEGAVRIVRALMPENVDVTDPVRRPYIDF